MAYVRNTIRNIDQALLLEARVLALQSEQTLGEVISAALETYLLDWCEGSEELETEC